MSRPPASTTDHETTDHETTDDEAATLTRLLRCHATGLLAEAAAVDLLTAHRHWLTHPVFTARFVHPVAAGDHRRIGAWIDWQAATRALGHGDLPCSTSQADMLRIAASLGADLPIILRDVLGGLDHTNIAAVTTAITAANGT